MQAEQMPPEVFEELVRDALDALPAWVSEIVAEIAVTVADEPAPGESPDGILLLGRYHGTPRTRHGGRVPGSLPDVITLYRLPILSVCPRPEDVGPKVLKVLGHEVGHAMGLEEHRLRELGWS